MLEATPNIAIPLAEFDFSYARSAGPGGQNVNKVNSKAILRWVVTDSPSLPDAVKARFINKFANRITIEGALVLSSQKFRDQTRNYEDCLEKLRQMIESVAVPPTPRKATKPSKAAKVRRVETKRQQSQRKQQRRQPGMDD